MSEENDIDSNIDWEKSKSFSKNTRVSRRIDQNKTAIIDNLVKTSFKPVAKPVKQISPNLKKIKNKIRDIYDEEDEDENEGSTVVFDFNFDDMSSSLYGVLSEEEKSRLNSTKDVNNMAMQQTAGKVADILKAEQVSKEFGLKDMDKKIITKTTQDVTFNNKTFEETLLKNISKKTKLRTEDLSLTESTNMVKGLNKMKDAKILSKENNLEALSENMKAQDFIEIGKEKSTAKTAKMILEKSGRKEAKEQTDAEKKEKKEKIKKIEASLKKIKTR